MSDAHEQLVATLRTIIAEFDDARTVIDHAIEDVEREKAQDLTHSVQEAPGPYTPNAWSIYAERVH